MGCSLRDVKYSLCLKIKELGIFSQQAFQQGRIIQQGQLKSPTLGDLVGCEEKRVLAVPTFFCQTSVVWERAECQKPLQVNTLAVSCSFDSEQQRVYLDVWKVINEISKSFPCINCKSPSAMPCKLSSQVRTCLSICDSLLSPINKSKTGNYLRRKQL